MNIVHCDAIVATRWRNGAGMVRDLLHWPTPSDWQLRISVADIDVDSPFSAYDGVERWFAVVEGAGVRLHLPGGVRAVSIDATPLHFRGEDAPACEVIDGPTRDLNLMLRRGSGSARMCRAEPGVAVDRPARLRALFSAEALTLSTGAGRPLAIAPFTLAWAANVTGPWCVDARAAAVKAWWMDFVQAER